jgi:hypothetical protein
MRLLGLRENEHKEQKVGKRRNRRRKRGRNKKKYIPYYYNVARGGAVG